jgi:hypothetical protein
MSARVASWLAWSLGALTVALVAFVVTFTVLTGTGPRDFTFLLGVVSSAIVGAMITSRRANNPVGWFFIVSAICFAVSEAAFRYAVYGLVINPGSLPLAQAMVWPQTWMWVPGIALIIIFVPLYFPNGHLLSSRWRPVLWLAIFFCVLTTGFQAFMPGKVSGVSGVTNPLGITALRPVVGVVESFLLLFPVVVLLSVASLVVRFWRSRGEERQQMKWITYAAGAIFTMIVLTILLDVVAPNSVLANVVGSLTGAAFAGIPVAVGIAILRYRLYEIDIIINRTLVYGFLTAMLALVYFGGVTTTQAIFRALTGQEQQPQIAIVISTLVIAALFNPLRRSIQSFIDRRFYRKKYDARKTLATFSARLRDETDLEALNAELVGVVRETMQPAHVSLWLRPDTASKKDEAPG